MGTEKFSSTLKDERTDSWPSTFNGQGYREGWGLWQTEEHTLALREATTPSSSFMLHERCNVFLYFFSKEARNLDFSFPLCVCV